MSGTGAKYCSVATPVDTANKLIAQRSFDGANYTVGAGLVRWLTAPTLAGKQVTSATLSGVFDAATFTDFNHGAHDELGFEWYSWAPPTPGACFGCENPDSACAARPAARSCTGGGINVLAVPVTPGPFTVPVNPACFTDQCINRGAGDGYTSLGIDMRCEGQGNDPACGGAESRPTGINAVVVSVVTPLCLNVYAVDVTPTITPTSTPTSTPTHTPTSTPTAAETATRGRPTPQGAHRRKHRAPSLRK